MPHTLLFDFNMCVQVVAGRFDRGLATQVAMNCSVGALPRCRKITFSGKKMESLPLQAGSEHIPRSLTS